MIVERRNGHAVERGWFFSGDDAIRARAATAPPEIKAFMDGAREGRGLPRLWPRASVFPPSSVPSSPLVVKGRGGVTARKLLTCVAPSPRFGYVLAGAVCPGTSGRAVRGGDGRVFAERFSPGAFDASLREIEAGRKVVELRDGHFGPAIASTAAGTLRFAVMPLVGLVMTARPRGESYRASLLADAISGRAGLSVSFASVREGGERDQRGGSVRVVYDAELDHVAVIRPGLGSPAYDTRLVAVRARRSDADRVAVYRAVLAGARIVVAQLTNP
jgi:phage head maturation protease